MTRLRRFPRFGIRAMLVAIVMVAVLSAGANFLPLRTAAKLADAMSGRDSDQHLVL